MMRHFLALLLLLSLARIALGEPAPLGFEIGKATVDQVSEKYHVKKLGINRFSQGVMLELPVEELPLGGVREATLIFDRDDRLVAVLLRFDRRRFNALLDVLSARYSLVSKRVPFVGDRQARFIEGNTIIELDSPHLAFDLTLEYLDRDFLQTYRKIRAEDARRARQREESAL